MTTGAKRSKTRASMGSVVNSKSRPRKARFRKRIIVCIDGTWNNFFDWRSADNNETTYWSNVHKIRMCIAERDGDIPQITLYSRGVGTSHYFDRVVGGVNGTGINEQILDAYMSLCDIYEEGDEIYLIGFSRGAVAVRALSGMIIKCGLLRAPHLAKIEDVWKYFTVRSSAERDTHSFRDHVGRYTYSDVPIKAIAVWDTVLGAKIERSRLIGKVKLTGTLSLADIRFENPELHVSIENAFHALSLNERRQEFKPILWTKIVGDDRTNPSAMKWPRGAVKQVWFPGVHSNVGGGYEDQGLSDISLDWIIRNLSQAGLKFHKNIIKEIVKPDILGRIYDSSKGWIGGSADRSVELNPDNHVGEKIHSSALALYGRNLTYANDIKRLNFQPACIEDRDGQISPEITEDGILRSEYMRKINAYDRSLGSSSQP